MPQQCANSPVDPQYWKNLSFKGGKKPDLSEHRQFFEEKIKQFPYIDEQIEHANKSHYIDLAKTLTEECLNKNKQLDPIALDFLDKYFFDGIEEAKTARTAKIKRILL